MNYLALVSRLRRKCGVSGDNPTSFTNQSEEVNRLIDWINEAWMDIQLTKPDWQWMRSSFSFATINAQATYTGTQAGLLDFGAWARDSVRSYVTSVGTDSEIELDYISYDEWRDTYQMGASRTVYTRPTCIAITPAKDLALGPVPAAGYTIAGEYYKVASEMSLTIDTPALPTQYHMAIVYRAMMYYGAYEAAPEVYNAGADEFKKMMGRLLTSRLPEVQVGGAIA